VAFEAERVAHAAQVFVLACLPQVRRDVCTHLRALLENGGVASEFCEVVRVDALVDFVAVFEWTEYGLEEKLEEAVVLNNGVQHGAHEFRVCVHVCTVATLGAVLDVGEVYAVLLLEVVRVEEHLYLVVGEVAVVPLDAVLVVLHLGADC